MANQPSEDKNEPVVIGIFTNKGGVGKTTLNLNLAAYLTKRNRCTMIVDGDPQCNATAMFFDDEEAFEEHYEDSSHENPKDLYRGFEKALQGESQSMLPVEVVPHAYVNNMYLLAGSLYWASVEQDLSLGLTGSMAMQKNLMSSLQKLVVTTAKRCGAEVVLIDMSPSLGAINQALLIHVCDYYFVPSSYDIFSKMAVNNLAEAIPRWFRTLSGERVRPKFAGFIMNSYRPYKDRMSETQQKVKSVFNFEKLIENVRPHVHDKPINVDIRAFNKLQTLSLEKKVPIAIMDKEYLKKHFAGQVLKNYMDMLRDNESTFAKVADLITEMVEEQQKGTDNN
eukprot:gb/GECH01014401.1/.p1 GENE.gb/GECH01014401.1/~~gb/GECH01014401.1/.p1  ORF type:complete len:338 (+),score=32.18 gb/GECH01014401.1/:1-1014(+)